MRLCVVAVLVALAAVAGGAEHAPAALVLVPDAEGAATELSGSEHHLAAERPQDHSPRMCCKALTASCLACDRGITEAEYCRAHPDTMGCPVPAEMQPPYDGPEFVATTQWQPVAEGQPIPPGLHVAVDMQTGDKKARLMPEGERPGILTMSERRAKKLGQIQEAIAAVNDGEGGAAVGRGDGTDLDGISDQDRVEAYLRSLAEIKAKGLTVRQDSETLVRLVEELSAAARGGDGDGNGDGDGVATVDPATVVSLLEDLEELVHHVDNAADFGKMGGYELLAGWVSNPNSSTAIRGQAAVALGAACSNNPSAQLAAAEAGALPRLAAQLQAAVVGGRHVEAKRTVHAIGALVRNQPGHAAELHSVGGLAALRDTLAASDGSHPLRVKVMRLVTDIATEAAIDPSTSTTDNLVAAHLCDFVEPLLTDVLGSDRIDPSMAEAVVGYARALSAPCGSAPGGLAAGWQGRVGASLQAAATSLADAAAAAAAADPEDGAFEAEVSADMARLAKELQVAGGATDEARVASDL